MVVQAEEKYVPVERIEFSFAYFSQEIVMAKYAIDFMGKLW